MRGVSKSSVFFHQLVNLILITSHFAIGHIKVRLQLTNLVSEHSVLLLVRVVFFAKHSLNLGAVEMLFRL